MIHHKLKNIKLKNQLIFLVVISICMMVVSQVFYYLEFSQSVQSKAELYVTNSINQANDRLNVYIGDIKNVALSSSYNSTVHEYFVNKDMLYRQSTHMFVSNTLKAIMDANVGIADIAIVDNDDNILTCNGRINFIIYKGLKSEYDINSITKAFTTPVIKTDFHSYFFYILPIYDINNSSNISVKIATTVIACDINYLKTIVQNTSVTKNSLFLIMDENEKIILKNKEIADSGKLIQQFSKEDSEGSIIKNYEGRSSLITVKKNKDLGWTTISIIPIAEINSDLKRIRFYGILIGAFDIILLLSLGVIFIRNVSSPISYIVKTLRKIGDKGIQQRIKLKGTNEIGIIANDVNMMLDKIENMTNNILEIQKTLYETQLGKKEAQILSLQSQINPHFLYNTLECIRSIGMVKRIPEIVNISTAMANIFRYSIKGGSFTKVADEVHIMKDYLSIMSIRFMGKFKIKINIDEAIMNKKIIKMILQPIVENAVYHGLEPKEDEGNLIINGEIIDGKVQFEIYDDGVGMCEHEVEKINTILTEKQLQVDDVYQKRGIGLININNRVKLHYGDEYGIKIISKENEGVTVILMLPLDNI